MVTLPSMTRNDVLTLGAQLRALCEGVDTMEALANRLVQHLYDHCRDSKGGRACSLIRFYKTHPYAALEPELQALAQANAQEVLAPQVRCLTLLATIGDEPAWNDRRQSVAHQAIPLPSIEVMNRLPMVSALVQQFGITLSSVVNPQADLILEPSATSYNVFYVAQAKGSPFIPAQRDFVVPYGIKSVLGFGSLLSPRDLFALVMFTRVRVSRHIAWHFSNVALSLTAPLMRYDAEAIFAPAAPTQHTLLAATTSEPITGP